MPDSLRPYLARLLAAVVPALIGWLCGKLGVKLDPTVVAELNTATVALLLYGISHTTLNKKMNPGDAASSKLAAVEKQETQELHRAD